MNGRGFVIAADGWLQLAPCGEFPHAGAGVTQVVDREACDRMAAEFAGRKADPNFPGVLVDFDHFSLDTGKSSEAAGWITDLESRDDGLWARVRWSDAGLAAVQGGRFRLVSPVFPAPADCEDLGDGRIRPVRLVSVALTNEPNIKGAKPIANRRAGDRDQESGGGGKEGLTQGREDAGNGSEDEKPVGDVVGGPGAKKFMWLLGDPPKGPHCSECLARAGKVKTLLEWLRMGAPKCKCYCRLAEVGKDVEEGDGERPTQNAQRSTPNGGNDEKSVKNRWSDAARAASLAARREKYGSGWGPNAGWSDAARAASLAVRRAKAAARSSSGGYPGDYFTYGDGTPVIRDFVSEIEETMRSYDPSRTSISDAAPFEARQRAYEEAFRRWWDGVETTAGNIEAFHEFVAAFGGMAAAAAGASSPAGAASRAFGVGGSRAGQTKGRRGSLSRAWGGLRETLRRLGEEPVTDEVAAAVEKAKADFRARRAEEASTLAEAIRRIDPNAPSGLENFSARHLKDYLRRLGGDPAKELNSGAPSDFEALKAKYGVSVPELEARARKAEVPTKAEIRESFAEYLMETLGYRPGNVDQNLAELETQRAAAQRGAARAKEAALSAQRETSQARWTYGEASPEYADALKAAESARWDYEHASRVSERIEGEYLSLRRNIDLFLERAREGGPIDWSAADADYNALFEEARRAKPLVNRRRGSSVAHYCGSALVGGGGSAAKRVNNGSRVMKNRWSDAARAASLAARREKYGSGWGPNAGWSDAARAASLAVRRAKAAARSSSGGYPGDYFTYGDGTPVIRDFVSEIGDAMRSYDPSQTSISDAAPFEARQRAYEEAFRRWWDGVETTAENIGKFHEFVAAFGGMAAAAAGAANPAGAASGVFGARYGGQKPVYNEYGEVVGWAKTGGRRAAARRSSRPARESVTADPLNDPKTPGDFALREAYGRYLSEIESSHEAAMAKKGLDPQGYPLVPPSAAAAAPYRPVWEKFYPDLESAEQGGRDAFNEGYARGEAPYGLKEGGAEWDAFWRGYDAEAAQYPGGYGVPAPLKIGPRSVNETPAAYGGGFSDAAAREAARALGVLHGAYGAGDSGAEIPEALRGDYELGLAEGAKGFDYGIVPPKDRAAVLRAAQAYLDGAVGDGEGYAPDHLNDRFNLEKWESAAKWAARNQGRNAVYDPAAPDTRGQYSPEGLMREAMEWFGDATVRGDRGGANAALSYMGDLLTAVAADRKAVAGASGGPAEGAEDEDAAEIDASMPEYDEDGNEVGGEPFFEDSYADPDALPPWWHLLGNRWSAAARAASLAARRAKYGSGWGPNKGWSDAARAASLAVRRAKASLRRAQDGLARKQAQALREGAGQDAAGWEVEGGPVIQGPLGFMPAWRRRRDQEAEREERRRRNEERKNAAKERLAEAREERRRQRNAPLREKFGGGNDGEGDDGQTPARRRALPVTRPVGFSVPVPDAVYYYNGRWYNGKGEVIG